MFGLTLGRIQFVVLSVLVVSLLNIGFLNCARAKFSSSAQKSGNSVLGGPDDIRDPNVILKTCQSHQAAGTLLTQDDLIRFEATHTELGVNNACPFGQGDNLMNYKEVDSRERARYEQRRTMSLPDGAELCDLDIELQTANSFKYDDMFYFSLNGRMLSSSNKTAMVDLPKESILLENGQTLETRLYRWSDIVNKAFDNDATGNNYCIGQKEGLSSCSWPMTQQTGSFRLKYAPEILVHFGAKAHDSHHELMFAVTGDNDPDKDCAHTGFNLKMKASYYIK